MGSEGRSRTVDDLSAQLLAGVLSPSDPHGSDLSPDLVRQLPISELQEVAADLRTAIVGAVERHGGHLGSNLGVVELALGVHRVFDSPRDVVLWDTGHQSYPHKMVTGRGPAFSRLSRGRSISAYPRPAESEHDWIENSHPGGAASWAHGLAEGLRAAGDGRRVVVVMGDGALTSGVSYEAIRSLGASGHPVVVVLNDNTGRLGAPPLFEPYPVDGEGTGGAAAERFFVALGFAYRGPIDGHDIESVCAALGEARDLGGPVVVHARTIEGLGHPTAEASRGQPPGHVAEPAGSSEDLGTFTRAFLDEIAALADADERVVVVRAATRGSPDLAELRSRHPDRVFDVGRAEQHAVGFAAGLAASGRRPVVTLPAAFFNRCFDQLVLDVSLHRAPVVLVLERAGIGPGGPSLHGVNDIALALMAPGVAVYAPSCPGGVGPALREAVARGEPAVLRLPENGVVDLDGFDGPPGTARRRRHGDAMCLAAVGSMVPVSYEAAGLLYRRGIGVDLWDVRRVRPLDDRFLAAASASSTLVTVEDGVAAGGAGSWIAHQLGQAGWYGHARHLGIPDVHVPDGSGDGLRSLVGLDAAGIAERCLMALDRSEGLLDPPGSMNPS